MSGPNKNYDPVEVTPLSADEVARMRDEALAAIAAAQTLDELKEARLAHFGDKAPLTLANSEIGALPPQARADAGKRVGAARGEVEKALAGRTAALEADRDRRVLLTEAVDVTLPWDRVPPGARHPVTMAADRLADVFVAMGYEVAEGPEAEAEWYNFDALNIPPDHPAREAQDTLFVAGPRTPATAPGTGPPHSGVVLRTHTSPVQIRAMLTPAAAAVRGQPGPVLPRRRAGRHPQPGLLPDRGPGRGRGPDHGRPARRDPGVRRRDVRRGAADAVPAGLLPVHRAVGRRVHGVPRVPGRVHPARRPAMPRLPVAGLDRDRRLRHGQPPRAGRLRHRPAIGTAGSRSASASSGP